MLYTSQLLAAASGKVGGLVASRNRAGQYFRAHAIPVNPNTIYQETVRTYFAQMAVAWIEQLTAAQRDAWNTYAANITLTGRVAQSYFATGQNHYIRSNVPRLQANLPRVDDAPTIFDLGEFTEPSIAPKTPASIEVTFTETDAWVGEDNAGLLVFGSRPQNDTINFFKGPYRFADSVDGDLALPPTSPDTIDSPFALTVGQMQFARTAVTRADGRLSYSVRVFGIVTAP